MPVVLSGQPSLSPSYPIFTNNNGTLYNHNEATETLAASYGYTDAGQGGIGESPRPSSTRRSITGKRKGSSSSFASSLNSSTHLAPLQKSSSYTNGFENNHRPPSFRSDNLRKPSTASSINQAADPFAYDNQYPQSDSVDRAPVTASRVPSQSLGRQANSPLHKPAPMPGIRGFTTFPDLRQYQLDQHTSKGLASEKARMPMSKTLLSHSASRSEPPNLSMWQSGLDGQNQSSPSMSYGLGSSFGTSSPGAGESYVASLGLAPLVARTVDGKQVSIPVQPSSMAASPASQSSPVNFGNDVSPSSYNTARLGPTPSPMTRHSPSASYTFGNTPAMTQSQSGGGSGGRQRSSSLHSYLGPTGIQTTARNTALARDGSRRLSRSGSAARRARPRHSRKSSNATSNGASSANTDKIGSRFVRYGSRPDLFRLDSRHGFGSGNLTEGETTETETETEGERNNTRKYRRRSKSKRNLGAYAYSKLVTSRLPSRKDIQPDVRHNLAYRRAPSQPLGLTWICGARSAARSPSFYDDFEFTKLPGGKRRRSTSSRGTVRAGDSLDESRRPSESSSAAAAARRSQDRTLNQSANQTNLPTVNRSNPNLVASQPVVNSEEPYSNLQPRRRITSLQAPPPQIGKLTGSPASPQGVGIRSPIRQNFTQTSTTESPLISDNRPDIRMVRRRSMSLNNLRAAAAEAGVPTGLLISGPIPSTRVISNDAIRTPRSAPLPDMDWPAGAEDDFQLPPARRAEEGRTSPWLTVAKDGSHYRDLSDDERDERRQALLLALSPQLGALTTSAASSRELVSAVIAEATQLAPIHRRYADGRSNSPDLRIPTSPVMKPMYVTGKVLSSTIVPVDRASVHDSRSPAFEDLADFEASRVIIGEDDLQEPASRSSSPAHSILYGRALTSPHHHHAVHVVVDPDEHTAHVARSEVGEISDIGHGAWASGTDEWGGASSSAHLSRESSQMLNVMPMRGQIDEVANTTTRSQRGSGDASIASSSDLVVGAPGLATLKPKLSPAASGLTERSSAGNVSSGGTSNTNSAHVLDLSEDNFKNLFYRAPPPQSPLPTIPLSQTASSPSDTECPNLLSAATLRPPGLANRFSRVDRDSMATNEPPSSIFAAPGHFEVFDFPQVPNSSEAGPITRNHPTHPSTDGNNVSVSRSPNMSTASYATAPSIQYQTSRHHLQQEWLNLATDDGALERLSAFAIHRPDEEDRDELSPPPVPPKMSRGLSVESYATSETGSDSYATAESVNASSLALDTSFSGLAIGGRPHYAQQQPSFASARSHMTQSTLHGTAPSVQSYNTASNYPDTGFFTATQEQPDPFATFRQDASTSRAVPSVGQDDIQTRHFGGAKRLSSDGRDSFIDFDLEKHFSTKPDGLDDARSFLDDDSSDDEDGEVSRPQSRTQQNQSPEARLSLAPDVKRSVQVSQSRNRPSVIVEHAETSSELEPTSDSNSETRRRSVSDTKSGRMLDSGNSSQPITPSVYSITATDVIDGYRSSGISDMLPSQDSPNLGIPTSRSGMSSVDGRPTSHLASGSNASINSQLSGLGEFPQPPLSTSAERGDPFDTVYAHGNNTDLSRSGSKGTVRHRPISLPTRPSAEIFNHQSPMLSASVYSDGIGDYGSGRRACTNSDRNSYIDMSTSPERSRDGAMINSSYLSFNSMPASPSSSAYPGSNTASMATSPMSANATRLSKIFPTSSRHDRTSSDPSVWSRESMRSDRRTSAAQNEVSESWRP